MDLWLVDSILCGRKINLGFLIVQHMANVLFSAHSILPYGMLLTTIFQYFKINVDGETDICICKPFDSIDNGSISRLGYELQRKKWVLKTTCVLVTAEEVSDEEAATEIPPPSPIAAPSSPSLTAGAGASSSYASFNYASAFQNLSQHLDIISLDVQHLQLDHQKDMRLLIMDLCTLSGDFYAYRELCISRRVRSASSRVLYSV